MGDEIGGKHAGTQNVLFLPTASTEADLELSTVLHRSASTTCLKPMGNKSTSCSVRSLTKQKCSKTSEAYCGSLRSGGHSGIPITRLAVIQT